MIAVQLAFTDDEHRLAARPGHRTHLAALYDAGELVAAGPFADDGGALLIYNVDETRLREIMAEDPYYYDTPGITVAWINEWNPLFGLSGK
jgi:uncharacterized protein YciI